MEHLAQHTGSWVGTNGFRLMPSDPRHNADARAEVSLAAKGNLAEIAYTWSHPDDGEQGGLLVVGRGQAPSAITAFWGDSWHQSPEPRILQGTLVSCVMAVGYQYSGEWRWKIVVDATDTNALVLRMDNTIPESAATESMAAGSYSAMMATMSRS